MSGRDKKFDSVLQPTIDEWIRSQFMKRECIRAVPLLNDFGKCVCGRSMKEHKYADDADSGDVDETGHRCWTSETCTAAFPTDAYGTLTFGVETCSQKARARYIRTDPGAEPTDLWRLLVDIWGLDPPGLVITVQDGGEETQLDPIFIKAFKEDLAKAANTASTWIITSGLQTGITRHITDAFIDTPRRNRSNPIRIIGFAPWGLISGREQLLSNGNDRDVQYRGRWYETGQGVHSGVDYVLDEGHSGFVLVDDGTVGRSWNKAFAMRRQFEDFLRDLTLGNTGSRCIPTVCLLVNGKLSALDALFEYVSNDPPIPVVACAGTGGVADWIVGICEKRHGNGSTGASPVPNLLRSQIQATLSVSESEANKLAAVVTDIVQAHQNHITIYRTVDSDSLSAQDKEPQKIELDVAMLDALLKSLPLTATEKLNLTVVWDREDLARKILEEICTDDDEGRPSGALDDAMMNALMHDRVGFVRLLLSNGIAMDRFLTVGRLERLYNTESGPPNTLRFALQGTDGDYKYKLPDIGWIIEKFMGFGFRSTYCRREFLKRYNTELENNPQMRNTVANADPKQRRRSTIAYIDNALNRKRVSIFVACRSRPHFAYPYHELFVWAVLTNRKQLAVCFWQNGEDQLAKALIGSRLYQSLAEEAEDDFLEADVGQELEINAIEFKTLAFELLAQCYETNDAMTQQLLTYELRQFSKSTCISLAANCQNEAFIAHQSCQILLADLWLGGLRVRKFIDLKVLAGVLFPPIIPLLTFKSVEELHFQARTVDETHKNKRSKGERRKSIQDDLNVWDSDEDSNIENEVMGGEANLAFIEDIAVESIPAFGAHQAEAKTGHAETSFSEPTTSKRAVTFSPSIKHESEKRQSDHYRETEDSALSPSGLSGSKYDSQDSSMSDMENDEDMDMHPTTPRQTRRCATASELVADQLGAKFLFDKPPAEPDMYYRQPLPILRRFLEFYSAPITAFWSFTICYVLFLSVFTYIVIVRTPLKPSWPEYCVIVFIITFSVDQIRKVHGTQLPISYLDRYCYAFGASLQILVQEPRRFIAKLKVFAGSAWDSSSVIACAAFFLALFLRLDPKTLATGRVLYCVNVGFWYLRMLRVLNVNSALSPYIYMYWKMVVQLFLMCAILLVIVVVFGIVRQAIMYQDEDWHWDLLRAIVYKPYAMLYGALYETEITECDDLGINCVPGFWLKPILMAVYLLLSVLMFLNIIVAALSNIFEEVTARAQEIAKFGAYRHVMEFEQQPFLPPPLVIFAHLYMIGRFLYMRFMVREQGYRLGRALRLLLTPEEKEKLHEFERRCVTELMAKKAEEEANSLEARLRSLTQRVDTMTVQVGHLEEQEQAHRMIISKVGFSFLSGIGQIQNASARKQCDNSTALPSLMRSISDLAVRPINRNRVAGSLPNLMDPQMFRQSSRLGSQHWQKDVVKTIR